MNVSPRIDTVFGVVATGMDPALQILRIWTLKVVDHARITATITLISGYFSAINLILTQSSILIRSTIEANEAIQMIYEVLLVARRRQPLLLGSLK